MNNTIEHIINRLRDSGLSADHEVMIQRELEMSEGEQQDSVAEPTPLVGLYDRTDFDMLPGLHPVPDAPELFLKTLEDLLEQDNRREKDGFPRRIRIGKIIRPDRGNKSKVVVVPSTVEPKFYHDDAVTEEGESTTGGAGDEQEGEVLGEQPIEPQQGEGEGQGAGQGEGAEHDVGTDAFDLGRVITEKFQLPNLKSKGSKRSFTKYVYDLTDRNRGFGQVLDKKATLRRIVETNIILERIKAGTPFDPGELIINPKDLVYRIMSKEKDFESQAVVFFLRDYSGSMQGDPTEVVSTQHLLIYSWLMYQYANRVMTRFILHDTDAKEVEDFYTYYKSQVAGGTRVAPAFELVNKIVEEEQLARDHNVYVFHGTDGDDWDEEGKELLEAVNKMIAYVNRIGITVAKNSWGISKDKTTIERNIENSGLLKEKAVLIKIDSFEAKGATEERIIESIKKLVG